MFGIDKSFWSRWEVALLIFIIIVSLVIAGGYTSYSVISSRHSPADHVAFVKNGDSVNVDYIGMFEDGTVFDTSMRHVAENNTQYPKSLSFTPKGEYFPKGFTVGTGQMIPGFDKGVIGMAVNQTKTLTISPEYGYGFPKEELIETWNLTESHPVFQWFGNTTEFIEMYQVSPNVGTNVRNSEFGWNMTVFHVDALTGKILVKNNPFIGEKFQSTYGWYSEVVSMDSSANKGKGEIIIRHLISTEDIGNRMFSDNFERKFTISGIDFGAETFTADFNQEVAGRTLIFKVTIVSINPAP